MNNYDENLAQIGESYIQAQQAQEKQVQEKQEKISVAETQITEEKDEFDIKALGNLICEVMDIIFSRIGWEKLNINEKQSLSNSFIGIVRKRVPTVTKWGAEIDFGIVMAVIILSRINIFGEVIEEKEGKEDESGNRKISNNLNYGPQGRRKDLFPRRVIKKIK